MKKFWIAFITIVCLSGCYYADTGIHRNYYTRQSRINSVHHDDSHFYNKEAYKVKNSKTYKPKAPKKYKPKAPKKYKPKAPKKYKPKALETKSGGSTKISHGGINPNKKKY